MFCSILISNYNKSKYLEKCLNSVFNQTYNDYEVIFSDNNSSDRSYEIASKYSNLKILQSERSSNSSPLNQINVIEEAFNISKGEYIFLLDSDDYFEQTKLERIVDFQKKNNFEFICDVPILAYNQKKFKKFKFKNYLNYFRSWPIIFPTSSLSFKKSFYIRFQNFLFRNEFDKLEIDFRLNTYANIEENNNIFTDLNLTIYNQVPDGIMSNYSKFDKKWWEKRLQAHKYSHLIKREKNLTVNKNLDFFVTNLINKF